MSSKALSTCSSCAVGEQIIKTMNSEANYSCQKQISAPISFKMLIFPYLGKRHDHSCNTGIRDTNKGGDKLVNPDKLTELKKNLENILGI